MNPQNQTTTLQRIDPEKSVEFVPFGAPDKIRLNIRIVQTMIATPTKSGKTCSERDAMRFLMLCQAQRLNPFAGDAYLVGYDAADGPSYSLIASHQSLLKRAETCPDFEGMESGVILMDGENDVKEREGDFFIPDVETVVGGWARVHRSGRKPMYRRLSIAQRKPRYPTPFWEGAKAAEQIVKCAEADALRSTFPTLLGGLYIQGEDNPAAAKVVSEIVRPIFPTREQPPAMLGPIEPGPSSQPAPTAPAQEAIAAGVPTPAGQQEPPRRRGRPPGSVNRPKETAPAPEQQSPPAEPARVQSWSDEVVAQCQEAGVSFDDFRTAIKNDLGVDISECCEWSEVPADLFANIKAATLAKIVSFYGNKNS